MRDQRDPQALGKALLGVCGNRRISTVRTVLASDTYDEASPLWTTPDFDDSRDGPMCGLPPSKDELGRRVLAMLRGAVKSALDSLAAEAVEVAKDGDNTGPSKTIIVADQGNE